MIRTAMIAAAALLVGGAAALAPSQSPAAAEQERFDTRVKPFLGKYCAACHSAKTKTGGLSVDILSEPDSADAHGAEWEKAMRKVRTGEMPPAGFPKPPKADADAVVQWASAALDRAAAAKPDPGRPLIHRLNRVEYNNVIRDLLAVDYTPADDFPADDSGYGFDNIADVLTLPPLLMEKYLSAAGRVSRVAVGTYTTGAAAERISTERRSNPASRVSDDLPLGSRGGSLFTFRFPVEGDYQFRIRVRGEFSKSMLAPKLDVRLDGVRIEMFNAAISTGEEDEEKRFFQTRAHVAGGLHQVGVTFLRDSAKWEDADANRPEGAQGGPRTNSPLLNVDYVEIGGPFDPKLKADSPSRRRIFSCLPAKAAEEEPCAKKVIGGLARRAYRRPVNPAEVESLTKFYRTGRRDGNSFEDGIQLALKAMLVSPHFLFRLESAGEAGPEPGVNRVADLDLASRLSFFLWSSIPDDELLRLAEQRKLHEPETLRAQTRRMLADGRSKALVRNFAGQWLHLRNLAGIKPDPKVFPDFDASLRAALQRETELFFEAVVREDRSVLDFIDGKFTYVNDRLARHYGMPAVKGAYFRRVELDGAQRSGVLTQGSILAVSSYPTRTSPVIRGKWILENLLGAPPPPPPANVPELNAKEIGKNISMRKQLEQHRANPSCSGCHNAMDPLGFALENYDAVGAWRAKDGEMAIDSAAELPNGRKFAGAAELKEVLREQGGEFTQCLTEKLLTYALGRGLQRYDKPVVRQIGRQMAKSDYKFSALVDGIVTSLPFTMKRPQETR